MKNNQVKACLVKNQHAQRVLRETLEQLERMESRLEQDLKKLQDMTSDRVQHSSEFYRELRNQVDMYSPFDRYNRYRRVPPPLFFPPFFQRSSDGDAAPLCRPPVLPEPVGQDPVDATEMAPNSMAEWRLLQRLYLRDLKDVAQHTNLQTQLDEELKRHAVRQVFQRLSKRLRYLRSATEKEVVGGGSVFGLETEVECIAKLQDLQDKLTPIEVVRAEMADSTDGMMCAGDPFWTQLVEQLALPFAPVEVWYYWRHWEQRLRPWTEGEEAALMSFISAHVSSHTSTHFASDTANISASHTTSISASTSSASNTPTSTAINWYAVAKTLPLPIHRSPAACMQTYKHLTLPAPSPHKFTAEEDARLLHLVDLHRYNFPLITLDMGPTMRRSQCYMRFTKSIDPSLRHGRWTPTEDATLRQLCSTPAPRWTQVALHLPGRSDVKCREHYQTTLQRTGFTGEQDVRLVRLVNSVMQGGSEEAAVMAAAKRGDAEAVLREVERAPKLVCGFPWTAWCREWFGDKTAGQLKDRVRVLRRRALFCVLGWESGGEEGGGAGMDLDEVKTLQSLDVKLQRPIRKRGRPMKVAQEAGLEGREGQLDGESLTMEGEESRMDEVPTFEPSPSLKHQTPAAPFNLPPTETQQPQQEQEVLSEGGRRRSKRLKH